MSLWRYHPEHGAKLVSSEKDAPDADGWHNSPESWTYAPAPELAADVPVEDVVEKPKKKGKK